MENGKLSILNDIEQIERRVGKDDPLLVEDRCEAKQSYEADQAEEIQPLFHIPCKGNDCSLLLYGMGHIYISKGFYNTESWCSEKWTLPPPKQCSRGTKEKRQPSTSNANSFFFLCSRNINKPLLNGT